MNDHIPSRKERGLAHISRGLWGTRPLAREEDHGRSLTGRAGHFDAHGVFVQHACRVCRGPVYPRGSQEYCAHCHLIQEPVR